jgi:hypothetical protein
MRLFEARRGNLHPKERKEKENEKQNHIKGKR